jgi:hypothetical protein
MRKNNEKSLVSRGYLAYLTSLFLKLHSFTLKIGAVFSSETSVSGHRTTLSDYRKEHRLNKITFIVAVQHSLDTLLPSKILCSYSFFN